MEGSPESEVTQLGVEEGYSDGVPRKEREEVVSGYPS